MSAAIIDIYYISVKLLGLSESEEIKSRNAAFSHLINRIVMIVFKLSFNLISSTGLSECINIPRTIRDRQERRVIRQSISGYAVTLTFACTQLRPHFFFNFSNIIRMERILS